MKRIESGVAMSHHNLISLGDIVMTPSSALGIVVGIYGAGYFEVFLNKGSSSARIVPFRQIDLVKIPGQDQTMTEFQRQHCLV